MDDEDYARHGPRYAGTIWPRPIGKHDLSNQYTEEKQLDERGLITPCPLQAESAESNAVQQQAAIYVAPLRHHHFRGYRQHLERCGYQ